MLKTFKRYLYLIHRWLGVVMCLFIALWFATGVIMMYVEYPELTEEERLATQEPLAFSAITLDVSAAEARTQSLQAFSRVRLSQVLGRPAYQFFAADGRPTTVFADNGELLQGLSVEQALLAALHSGFTPSTSQPSYEALVDVDQWTVTSSLNPARPLHKVALNDEAGTVLYISDVSGQPLRDTARTERFWNWLGSTIHWIYPWQLRQHADLWADILTYLSLVGVVSVCTGGIIGFIRLRVNRRYRDNAVTPYKGFNKWHHLLGLGSLLFVSTFMFSGLMSMLPWGLFDNQTDVGEQITRYSGGDFNELDRFPVLTTIADTRDIKEVEWQLTGGTPLLVLSRSASDKQVFAATGPLEAAQLRTLIEAAVPALQPTANVLGSKVVSSYDNYYYSHHNRYRPLPALHVEFDDAESSWYDIDLSTGTVIQRLTHTDRVARWLYNGMHSLDFTLLFQHRPIWDVTIILLCIFGFCFAVTSVVIGWRRLVYRTKHPHVRVNS